MRRFSANQMADDTDFIKLVLKASWSMEEAAHLVHETNPETNPVKLEGTTSDPIDRTYIWLKKEYGKNRLYAVIGKDVDSPRFSPGTLMRHMKKNKRFVSSKVQKIYNVAHGLPGAAGLSAEARKIYLDAADLIWQQLPDLPAARMAKMLTDLPEYFPMNQLPRYAEGTIRKWLKGRGPGKPGRPSKTALGNESPNLDEIASKLGKN